MVRLAVATAVAALVSSSAVLAAATPAREAGPAAPVSTYVRSCAQAVFGDLGPARRWQPTSVVVGPFAFAWIRAASTATRTAIVHGYRSGQGAVKALAVVKVGRVVAVSVPVGERRHVALLYDPSAFDRRQTVSHGEQSVTFRACRGAGARRHEWEAATQFNGGVIVDSPRCVRLTIRIAGGRTRTVAVPFGPVSCRTTG